MESNKLKIVFTCDAIEALPHEIASSIKWDAKTAILSFDYKPEMKLLKPIEFKVTAFLDCSFTCGYGKDKPVVDLEKGDTKEVWAETTVKFQDVE